jgi:ubiquinone/menaquinone biosynthesis C-methylase UbiE
MQQEAEFHDHLRDEAPHQRYSVEAEAELKDDPNWSNFKFYSIERSSRSYVEEWIRARCQGKRMLDYCCGNGDDSIFAAKHGAQTVGIDISPVSIENGRKKAVEEGVADRAQFEVMNAEELKFEDNSFDLAVVYGVLHHLDFAKAMKELSRVLKPGGEVICTEALAHNPIIHAYRKKTPHLRTPWEVDHILRKETIDSAGQWFGKTQKRFYHLATLAAVPLRRTFLFRPLLGVLRAIDWVLLSLPWLRWQAWQCVFVLSQPRKEGPKG